MRSPYHLRSALLALTMVACGRVEIDLLPLANSNHMPVDAQANDNVEDASLGLDEAGAPVDAVPHDAAAADGGPSQSDAGADASIISCAGEVVLGVCWYLGEQGATCTNVCSTHGGYDTAATSRIGTSSQGGSLANCQQVLRALGTTATPLEGTRSDSLGLGCHVWNDGQQPWWLSSPATNPDSAIPVARIACGCNR